MTKEKLLCIEDLRHAEYYDMQSVLDDLYAKSRTGQIFTSLTGLIFSRENILLAYRNIKSNDGSKTAGTDNLTIKDIGRLTPNEVIEKVKYIIDGTKHGYRPKPVRRKDIPKPNGDTRPLGIPCIWDRLIQQCIKQIMEPICEAKFSENSYGFRPNCSVENAIHKVYNLMQLSHLHYVIEFDIKGFFDNVNHSKLIKQIWAMGIRDKRLIYILKRILKAPIKMPDGSLVYPQKGTPQGGIISPLLANIVLNELDHWVESQWQKHPVTHKYSVSISKSGLKNYGHGYRAMKTTNLKEMFIVRYADDFRVFCRTKSDAEKTKIATTQWLLERLKLEVSQEKTRVVNIKRKYSEFLGFKIKVQNKGNKQVVKSHICDKQFNRQCKNLKEQIKRIDKPTRIGGERDEIKLYNSMVVGVQNYYSIATHISIDGAKLNNMVMRTFTNRLGTGKRRGKLRKKGRQLSLFEKERYGKSAMLRYVAGVNEPVYPIGYIRYKIPRAKKPLSCVYSIEGRKGLHNNLRVNMKLLLALMKQSINGRSIEYADNRIFLFSAQWGKCAVTGRDFLTLEDIHCHHKKRRSNGGGDEYSNLVLVLKPIHNLIHATDPKLITAYLKLLNLDKSQLDKLNKFREMAGYSRIA